MPYNVDPEQNKVNPFTPDQAMSLNDQFIYRFSALEETVRSGFRRVDENLNRLTNDLHDRHIEINDRISKLDKEFSEALVTMEKKNTEALAFKRARIDGVTQRVSDLETWSKVLTARLSIAFGAVLCVWTVIAPYIRNVLGVPNG